MSFEDFKNQIIVRPIDVFIGTKHRVKLQLIYKPHMKDDSMSGFIGEKGFDVDDLKKMDALEPYNILWSEKEKSIEAYFFHKIVK
jgi:hypothetical protein